MGDSRPAYEIDTFSSHADGLRLGEILPFVHSRDSPTTWSTSIHSVGLGPEVYNAFLEEFPKGYGHTADDEYNFPPSENYTDVRGHAASMRPGSLR